ncbi:hypothetical protein I3760_12G133400 [Carya illinoinensis]|uniref:uncharacterized protein LOC122288988 isoform X2 n=1 Tax=Carya illinoinensis TaxID=32201 RepID=UPI001BF99279|nr:uncharacterized protein LOC122288988 isoform X2 [Carya illinoinensis]KAG2678221.1 hypothetical protein I3760_12G133400 [Carya illinoinensis]KAG2678227.1 hypothetical protein I3760_12G133400 [Carya illinoinensis]
MTGTSHSFVEWREEFVSQERGNRVVHYFLKDSSGESILAVVGTERSVRHMFYVVSEEFLQVYGKESSIHAGYKWRSRREVVDWLTSMLSKQHLPGGSGSPSSTMDGMGAPQTQAADDTGHIAIFKGHHPDIVWSGVAWKCGKQLKHYPSFCRNGTTIAIQSFVFVMAKGENHYLAYLEDMYEDKRGQKKVKVRWFHHTQEVEGKIPIRNPHPKEVFMTPYVQVISAECVDGPATVLTREHYEKCITSFPHPQCARIHLCYRQFRNNRVKPFDLSKLRGYFDQPILSCLVPNPFSTPESISLSLTGEEAEQLSSGENVKVGAKRTRSGRVCRSFAADHSGVRNSVRINQTITYEPYENLDYSLSGSRRLLSRKHIGCHVWHTPLFKVDEKIELLCHDSGIRGCWFRCTVLQVSRKQMKVQYDDVQDEDGYGNLEEWIPTSKMAMPDKLGMRHLGRPAIRPAPPSEEQVDLAIEVGTAVDAWWSDGWWEGVVTGLDDSGDSTMQIYFPGESILLNVQKKDLRKSKDWMGDRWVDIQGKPDILSDLSATIGLDSKLSPSSNIAKDIKSGVSMSCADSSTRFNIAVDEKLDLPAVASSDGLPEDMERVVDGKSPPLNDKGNRFEGVDTNSSCNNGDDLQGDDDDDNDKHDNDGESGDDTQNFDYGQNCKAELMELAAQDVQ